MRDAKGQGMLKKGVTSANRQWVYAPVVVVRGKFLQSTTAMFAMARAGLIIRHTIRTQKGESRKAVPFGKNATIVEARVKNTSRRNFRIESGFVSMLMSAVFYIASKRVFQPVG